MSTDLIDEVLHIAGDIENNLDADERESLMAIAAEAVRLRADVKRLTPTRNPVHGPYRCDHGTPSGSHCEFCDRDI